jgi:adenosylcobinamide-GDP ribazoletransferase
MFTKIPVRNFAWDERQGANAAIFLPVVGAVCGIASFLAVKACRVLACYGIASADPLAAMALLSLFCVCGFLHWDGFMDTVDCLLSSRDREGKLRILKDSNTGAFSVVAAGLLLVCLFASIKAWLGASEDLDFILVLAPAFSRAWAAFLMFSVPTLETSSLMRFFTKGASEYHRLSMLTASTLAALLAAFEAGRLTPVAFAVGAALGYVVANTARKELGGINGDIIGATIVLTEAAIYFAAPIAAQLQSLL